MSKQNSNGTCGDGKEILMKGLESSGLRAGQTRTPLWSPAGDGRSRDIVRGNCVVTGIAHSITVYRDELDKWLTSDCLIQNALITDINADDREFLMTGISPQGWDIIFPKTGMDGYVGDEVG